MSASQLHTLLQDQLASARDLVQTLESEAEALTRRDVESIERLAAEKQRLTSILAEIAQALVRPSAEQDPANRDSAIGAAIGKDPTLQALWEESKPVLATAQALNQTNGRIVELGLNQVTRTLRILTTDTDMAQHQVYSASGKVAGGSTRPGRVVRV